MKLRSWLPLAASLVAFAPRAIAQLEESPAQIEARFGKPTEQWNDEEVHDAKCYRFERNGFEIDVTFLGGHVAAVAFSKLSNAELSDTEIQGLLGANKSSSSWCAPGFEKKPYSDGKPEVWWDRADDLASASYWYDEVSKRRILNFETEAYSLAQEAAEAKPKPRGRKR